MLTYERSRALGYNMDSFLNWLKHGSRLYLSVLPVAALYGILFPWPAAEQALSRYPGETPLVIALSFGSKTMKDAQNHILASSKHETRSYILLPSVFTDPKIVTISQVDDNAPSVSELSAPLMLILLVGTLGLSVFGVWYFWFRPDSEYQMDQLDPEKIKPFTSAIPSKQIQAARLKGPRPAPRPAPP